VEHVASVARLRHVEAMVEEKRRRRRDARKRRRVVGVEAAEAARARMRGAGANSKDGKPGFGGCEAGARKVGGGNERVRLLEKTRAVALRAQRELGFATHRCTKTQEREWRRRRLVLEYLASW
jgi:hypothetical protein